MRRGFKTEAESRAEQTRKGLGLTVFDRLPARRLLRHLNAVVTTAALIPGMTDDDIAQLTKTDPGAWSAATATREEMEEMTVVIVNGTHTRERQESSLHHEAAHVLCGHTPSQLIRVAGLTLREYDAAAEEEATWLAGCLHIPRPALVSMLRRGADETAVGEKFVASSEMVRYRRSVTGVDRQLHAREGKSR